MKKIKWMTAGAVFVLAAFLWGCAASSVSNVTEPVEKGWEEEKINHSMELLYAEQFSVDYYDNGYTMLNIKESGRYLVVPKGQQVPADIPQDVVVIQRPLDNIYLAATSAMDLFSNLDSVNQITLSGTKEEGWYINEAKGGLSPGQHGLRRKV